MTQATAPPMIARRQYRNPPIEEALCEFHFAPGPEWDFAVSGKLHIKLATQYTGKPQEQKSLEADVNMKAGKPPKVKHRERLARVRLVTADGKRMVSVGHDVMSVHMLRPYQDPNRPDKHGWDEFLPRISEALDAYWEVAEPTKISRIGVRYINKIVIPQKRARLQDYLRLTLPRVSGLPQSVGNFLVRVEYVYPDNVRLGLTQGLAPSAPEGLSLLVDLDVVWQHHEGIDKAAGIHKLVKLRDLERNAFDALITDKARDLFDAT